MRTSVRLGCRADLPIPGLPCRSMKVMCWNLSFGPRGDGSAHEKAWRYVLEDVRPDLALVQQARPPDASGGSFRYVAPDPDDPWASVVATNLPVERVAAAPASVLARLGASIACTRVRLPGGEPAVVASVYTKAAPVSPKDLVGVDVQAVRRSGQDEVWHNDLAFAALVEVTEGSRFIVGGDWQTGRLLDERQERHGGAGREFFERAERDGWVECLRRFHEREQRTLFRGNVPYQLDHVFCDRGLAAQLTSCDVVPEPATSLGLSDRAPILMELDL